MTLIVIHDNGSGRYGFTKQEIQSELEIQSIIDVYKESGITVHDYFTVGIDG